MHVHRVLPGRGRVHGNRVGLPGLHRKAGGGPPSSRVHHEGGTRQHRRIRHSPRPLPRRHVKRDHPPQRRPAASRPHQPLEPGLGPHKGTVPGARHTLLPPRQFRRLLVRLALGGVIHAVALVQGEGGRGGGQGLNTRHTISGTLRLGGEGQVGQAPGIRGVPRQDRGRAVEGGETGLQVAGRGGTDGHSQLLGLDGGGQQQEQEQAKEEGWAAVEGEGGGSSGAEGAGRGGVEGGHGFGRRGG